MDYEGIVIEESLGDTAVLGRLMIRATHAEPVSDWHRTPWLSQWTMHSVVVPEGNTAAVAAAISLAIDREYTAAWYADFRNDIQHYVIFSDRVFLIDRRNRAEYAAARAHGIVRGLPVHQADFVSLVQPWPD